MIDDEYKKLSNVATISVGYPFRGVVPEVEGSGLFVVQLKDTSLELGIDWPDCIETELKGKRKPDWIMPGDILFSSRGRNNYAVMVDGIPESMKVVASPHFYVIRSKLDHLLSGYLTWLLNQPPCQRHVKRQAEGSFTQSIRRNVIEDTPITIPSVEKQKSIINLAKILREERNTLTALIHNSEVTMNAIANDLFASDPSRETK